MYQRCCRIDPDFEIVDEAEQRRVEGRRHIILPLGRNPPTHLANNAADCRVHIAWRQQRKFKRFDKVFAILAILAADAVRFVGAQRQSAIENAGGLPTPGHLPQNKRPCQAQGHQY
jgi:hypothetical protein